VSSESVGARRRPALIGLVAVVIVAVVATVAVVVVSGGTVKGRPVAGYDPTVWQRIDAGADEGVPTTATALAAFSYLFGPVPGVGAPPGRRDPAGFTVSGSGPLRWVLGHWAELSPEQQRAVAKVINPPDEPPRLRQSDKDKAAPAIRAELDRLVADIGGRLGRTLPSPRLYLVDIERNSDNGNPVRAWSMVLADGESIADDGDGPLLTSTGGPADSCSVYVPPSLWRAGLSADSRSTLAHEVVHCYQGFGYPTLTQFRAAPAWIIEGGAEFGGIDVAGKAAGSPTNWFYYLAQQAPLFDRTYSAMGWWFHLQHVGHNPWQAFAAIWQGAMDNVTAYTTAGGDLDDVYDTWGSSLLRRPGYGDPWEVHGVDVSSEVPPRETLSAEGGSLSVAAFDARAAEVAVGSPSGGAEIVVLVTANQPIRVHDSGGFEDVHITEGDYCVGARCVCPEETEREGEEIQRVEPSLWLGVSGGETGTSVTTDTMTIEEYCRKKPPERRKPDPAPGAPGTRPHAPPGNPNSRSPQEPPAGAGSNGDPHLTSFDGHSYDFQAGGEFTLALGGDDLEIQARQEAYRGGDGRENLSVSINTAVAANVAGDRVTVTAAPDRPELRVDGDVLTPRAEQELPGGGSVAPNGGGYALRWPDGTTLWVVPIGQYGMNVAVRPAAERKGKLTGLLGPFEGRAGNPAMVDRDGKRYPSVTSAQIYGELGESWRVPADGSLFDYEQGRSTRSYTRKDMPGPPPIPTQEQKAAADAACAGITDTRLRAQCAFDVAATGDDGFVPAYEEVGELVVVGGDGIEVGRRVGPERLEPGQQKTFTLDGDTTALYFASDTDPDCAKSVTVFWRVTAPDGTESLSTGMCADVGRRDTAKAGTWRVDVSIPPDAGEGGEYAFRALEAGERRTKDVSLPTKVDDGTLGGPGAEHRYEFDGLAGDKVTMKATADCGDVGPLYWGLSDPNGFVITLRTPACEDLGEQTLTSDGRWSIVVFNPGDDGDEYRYGFTAGRG
jgi:VWD domain-containing protein